MQFYVRNFEQLPIFKEAARRSAEEYLDWRVNSANLCQMFAETAIRSDSSVRESEILVEAFERERGGIPQLQVQKSGVLQKFRSFFGRWAG
jgi:hypothetical protein